MKKHLFTLSGVLCTILSFGQVGVNTENPKVTLDVSALRTADGSIDGNNQQLGLQAPRITLAELTDNTATYGSDQKGALIYVTDVSGGNNSSPRVHIEAEGYYYFDGTLWQKVGSGGGTSGDTTDDAWLNDASGSMVKLATKADGVSPRDTGTAFVAKDNGNVGIGTSSPDESAILELQTSNKGFLLPRITLNSINDRTAITNPAKGLTVYNTNTNLVDGEGIYFNAQTPENPLWKKLSTLNTSLGNEAAGQMIRYPIEPAARFSGTRSLVFQRNYILPNGVGGSINTINGAELAVDNTTISLPVGTYRIDVAISGLITPSPLVNSGSIDFYIDNGLYSEKYFSAGGTQSEMIIINKASQIKINLTMFSGLSIVLDTGTTGKSSKSTLFITKLL